MTSHEADRPAPPGAFPERQRVWRFLAPLSLALLVFVLLFAGWRLARPAKVYLYTEGPVLGSLAALEQTGDLSSLYPADGWSHGPTVLTLYPPTYFGFAFLADGLTGDQGTLLGLRLVSSVGLGVVLALLGLAIRRRGPAASWILALIAAALRTPGVFSTVAGAQPDALALMWTWIGVTAALAIVEPPSGGHSGFGLWLAAGSAFLAAFFTKQSYIAAPAAFVLSLFLAGRRFAAFGFATAISAVALSGIALLDGLTAGGYTANALDALMGSFAWANMASAVAASRPEQWIPLVLVAGLGLGRMRRAGLPEIYLMASMLLHATAMFKTGSSVNYLLEPTFALLLLATLRGRTDADRRAMVGRRTDEARAFPACRVRPAFVTLLAVACMLTATRAGWREMNLAWGWFRAGPGARVSEFEGAPLVDPYFVPAVLERGRRPWLNDPYAFGVLEESGQWDPSPLVEDLASGRVPFLLTLVDLGPASAPPGIGSRELVMAYFWRSEPIWTAITTNYEPLGSGPVFVWLPRDGGP